MYCFMCKGEGHTSLLNTKEHKVVFTKCTMCNGTGKQEYRKCMCPSEHYEDFGLICPCCGKPRE